jgi:hypothetical protein
MVEPVASLAAWLWHFPAAPSRNPLRKKLTEGGVAGFYSIIQTGREKIITNSTIYFNFLILIDFYPLQK